MYNILLFIFLNIKTIIIFLFIYSICVITIYLYYNIKIRKIPLSEALKNYRKILKLLFVYKYPKLELLDFGTLRNIITKMSVPYSQLNILWMDEMYIHLKNANYTSDKHADITIELKELILKKDCIEFLYDTKTKGIVKTKGKTLFILNDKEYVCKVDEAQKRITANCSGYYISNDSIAVFKSKFSHSEEFYIDIDTSNFYNTDETYKIIDLINVCIILFRISMIISSLIILVICFYINFNIIFSVIFMVYWLYIHLYSISARLLDVLKNLKYE